MRPPSAAGSSSTVAVPKSDPASITSSPYMIQFRLRRNAIAAPVAAARHAIHSGEVKF